MQGKRKFYEWAEEFYNKMKPEDKEYIAKKTKVENIRKRVIRNLKLLLNPHIPEYDLPDIEPDEDNDIKKPKAYDSSDYIISIYDNNIPFEERKELYKTIVEKRCKDLKKYLETLQRHIKKMKKLCQNDEIKNKLEIIIESCSIMEEKLSKYDLEIDDIDDFMTSIPDILFWEEIEKNVLYIFTACKDTINKSSSEQKAIEKELKDCFMYLENDFDNIMKILHNDSYGDLIGYPSNYMKIPKFDKINKFEEKLFELLVSYIGKSVTIEGKKINTLKEIQKGRWEILPIEKRKELYYALYNVEINLEATKEYAEHIRQEKYLDTELVYIKLFFPHLYRIRELTNYSVFKDIKIIPGENIPDENSPYENIPDEDTPDDNILKLLKLYNDLQPEFEAIEKTLGEIKKKESEFFESYCYRNKDIESEENFVKAVLEKTNKKQSANQITTNDY